MSRRAPWVGPAPDVGHRTSPLSADERDISFVIPALNEATYLRDTLRLLGEFRRRSLLSAEIIVVDGGSTDGTVAISEEFADQVLHEPTTKGTIARARNIGGFAARGRVLIHMDADSRFPCIDELVQRAVMDVESHRWVGATVSLQPLPCERRPLDTVMHAVMNALVKMLVPLGGWFAKGECQIIDAAQFRELGGYDERLAVAEDCDMFRRLGTLGPIVLLPDFSVHHSIRRFRTLGYRRVFGSYIREAVWLMLFGHNYLSTWREVR